MVIPSPYDDFKPVEVKPQKRNSSKNDWLRICLIIILVILFFFI